MNKTIILFFAAVFELAGNFVPMLFGDNDFFSGWSILGGIIGGLFGIWVGVLVSKRLG
jgi:drug/metabolite transporter superfamily protein YnfA